MDNVTHSLVGALLGQMGLKRKTGLAMPTLIIAANIPDIDAGCTVLGTVSLAMRRGITHGPIAMLVLPLLLTGAMIGYDRWQTRRGKRPADRLPLRPGWLLALAYLGCLSHPLFDWMNSYGVRLLEPFSHRWFYGDALFIVDPWLLAMLIAGVWLSRKRDNARRGDWRRPAWAVFCGVLMFIAINLTITWRAEALARHSLKNAVRFDGLMVKDLMVVANPVPLKFWNRSILWRDERSFGDGEYDVFKGHIAFDFDQRFGCAGSSGDNICVEERYDPPRLRSMPLGISSPIVRHSEDLTPAARAFLFWSRMPVVTLEKGNFLLKDQRFLSMPTAGNFEVELKP